MSDQQRNFASSNMVDMLHVTEKIAICQPSVGPKPQIVFQGKKTGTESVKNDFTRIVSFYCSIQRCFGD